MFTKTLLRLRFFAVSSLIGGVLFVSCCSPQVHLSEVLGSVTDSLHIPAAALIYGKRECRSTYCMGAGVTDTTVFQACSLGKVIMAYVAMRYVERGILDLDKPLSAYYVNPRFADADSASLLTARMCLGHHTGLSNWAADPDSDEWPRSLLHFKYAPGRCFSYSGEGFAYLQQALEQITGKSMDTMASEEVFAPLGMVNSCFIWRADFEYKAVRGYFSDGRVADHSRFFAANAAYTLHTTVADYARFVGAFMRGYGLSQETWDMMTAFSGTCFCCNPAQNAEANQYVNWGLGVGLCVCGKEKILWHWGDNGPFQCFFAAFPQEKEYIVYFTNAFNGLDMMAPVLRLFFPNRENSWRFIPEWLCYHYGE